jgi:hypothetical protein
MHGSARLHGGGGRGRQVRQAVLCTLLQLALGPRSGADAGVMARDRRVDDGARMRTRPRPFILRQCFIKLELRGAGRTVLVARTGDSAVSLLLGGQGRGLGLEAP